MGECGHQFAVPQQLKDADAWPGNPLLEKYRKGLRWKRPNPRAKLALIRRVRHPQLGQSSAYLDCRAKWLEHQRKGKRFGVKISDGSGSSHGELSRYGQAET